MASVRGSGRTSKIKKDTAIVSFMIEQEHYQKLKIHSVLHYGGELYQLLLDIVKQSKEVKNMYKPIKELAKIPNFRDFARKKGFRDLSIMAKDDLHKKLKVMVIVNDVPLAQLLNYIVKMNYEEFMKEEK